MIVGFAGSGNMVAGMARGWASAEGGPERMLFTDAGSGRAEVLAGETGGEAVATNQELAASCDLLVLGVKPKDLEAVAAESRAAPAVLSMLGATPVGRVAGCFPDSTALRLMPNLGVEVHRGVMCLAAADGAPRERVEEVISLLAPLGRVVELADELIDPATAVMGCTPAYLALIGQAIASEGAREGLDSDLSFTLMNDTAAATAELLRTRTARELIEAVASPGGSTEAGLRALDREGARRAFEAAVQASLARMRGQNA
jgi:pyrroline-5-carboxylate reductase